MNRETSTKKASARRRKKTRRIPSASQPGEKDCQPETDRSGNRDLLLSEVHEYLSVKEQRRRILPRAALVGLFAGIIALMFRLILTSAEMLRNRLLAWSHAVPDWGWLFPLAFTLFGAVIAVALTRRFAPEASGSGIPHLEAVLHRFRSLRWQRVLSVKFLGGVIAIGSGLILGREGPTVQMGGAVGDALSRGLKASQKERLTLITAGAGSGLAAAFNAPLSGLVFVLEEVRRDFQPIVFGAVFVAAVVADVIVRIDLGQSPVFAIPDYAAPPLSALPVFAVLGVVAGVLGVVFNRSLLAAVELQARLPPRPWPKADTAWPSPYSKAISCCPGFRSSLPSGSC